MAGTPGQPATAAVHRLDLVAARAGTTLAPPSLSLPLPPSVGSATALVGHTWAPGALVATDSGTVLFAAHSPLSTLSTLTHIHCAAFSPTGSSLVVGSTHEIPRIVDVQTGQLYMPGSVAQYGDRSGWSGPVRALAYSPESASFFVGGSSGGTVRFWDGRSGTMVNSVDGLVGDGGPVKDIALSRDERLAAVSGAADGSTALLDLRTGKLLARLLPPPPSTPVPSTLPCPIAFSADDALLLTTCLVRTPASHRLVPSLLTWDITESATDALAKGAGRGSRQAAVKPFSYCAGLDDVPVDLFCTKGGMVITVGEEGGVELWDSGDRQATNR
eukprot:CAMPEP_0170744958 /NCGR_PEP_ID=MMETSP0437-20130122/8049_1 /TAXON_ID=0 /ORGANISM="Sexangularia sp." /LENGTH=329 /DNA_ID=CAMNT_0011083669 /DNA_START=360 /DNA_END=1347 /DNA_ORIENTATION=-